MPSVCITYSSETRILEIASFHDSMLIRSGRRLRINLGPPCAIKAMAAKLARLVCRMLRYAMKYVDQGAAFYELRHRELQIKRLKSNAATLGYQLTPIPAAA